MYIRTAPIVNFINANLLKSLGLYLHRRTDLDRDRTFSCFDEEKILGQLIENTPNVENFYVDIGAHNGVYNSNTARLALNDWQGVCFEFDSVHFSLLASTYADLEKVNTCRTSVTPDNICHFLNAYNVPKNFGVLSLDIDCYDYFILEALLESFSPDIIVAEINECIPPPLEFTVLYNPSASWDGSSYFQGQSLSQLEILCHRFDYAIHTLEYNNAFLVSREKYTGPGLSAKDAYQQGYVSRPDRKEKMPWNAPMETLLNMTPDEAEKYLRQEFDVHEGNYSLTYGNHS